MSRRIGEVMLTYTLTCSIPWGKHLKQVLPPTTVLPRDESSAWAYAYCLFDQCPLSQGPVLYHLSPSPTPEASRSSVRS